MTLNNKIVAQRQSKNLKLLCKMKFWPYQQPKSSRKSTVKMWTQWERRKEVELGSLCRLRTTRSSSTRMPADTPRCDKTRLSSNSLQTLTKTYALSNRLYRTSSLPWSRRPHLLALAMHSHRDRWSRTTSCRSRFTSAPSLSLEMHNSTLCLRQL